jgi:hypothetical protein
MTAETGSTVYRLPTARITAGILVLLAERLRDARGDVEVVHLWLRREERSQQVRRRDL